MAEDDVVFDGEKEYSGRRFYCDDGRDRGEHWHYRFTGEFYDSFSEADEIRAMQCGDKQAEDRLIKHFQPLLGKHVSEFYGDTEEDLTAIAQIGLLNGLRDYDLTKNSRVGTYLEHKIDSALHDALRGSTRAERVVYANPDERSIDKLVELSGYSLKSPAKREKAEIKIEEALLKRRAESTKVEYNTTEATRDDDYDGKKGIVLSGDIGGPEAWRHAKNSYRGRLIEFWAEEEDRRERERLEEIGRSAYALELVERDRAREAARSDEAQYLYPKFRNLKGAT
jgi:hypothetical protein